MNVVAHFLFVLMMASLILGSPAVAQQVHTGQGMQARTPLVGNIHLNENSSLSRQWIIVNDDQFPVWLSPERFGGVNVAYSDRNYEYRATFRMRFDEPVSAFRVIFVTFDIWNNRVSNLNFTEVGDIDRGEHSFSASWRILTENEASLHFTTLAYVDRIRLVSGEVRYADTAAVVEQARMISSGFSDSDLLSAD